MVTCTACICKEFGVVKNTKYYILSYEQDNDLMSREHSVFSYWIQSLTKKEINRFCQVVPIPCWSLVIHLGRERHSVCTLSSILDIIQRQTGALTWTSCYTF